MGIKMKNKHLQDHWLYKCKKMHWTVIQAILNSNLIHRASFIFMKHNYLFLCRNHTIILEFINYKVYLIIFEPRLSSRSSSMTPYSYQPSAIHFNFVFCCFLLLNNSFYISSACLSWNFNSYYIWWYKLDAGCH